MPTHQYNDDLTGYAQFSDDMTMRYHLIRAVSVAARQVSCAAVGDAIDHLTPSVHPLGFGGLRVATFLLLNPSDADAFKPDPTVTTCVKFTLAWGYDITWVVNQHAFRSPHPTDLKKRACGFRGDDSRNNQAILIACRSANMVIAGWGNDGALDYRDRFVRNMLSVASVSLHHLGLTDSGAPKHPMARGKHRIPDGQIPTPWEP